jgi:hypothetical protein
MDRRFLKVGVVAAVMALGLQGAAQAVIVGPGPAPGSDGHEFDLTGEFGSVVEGSYAAKKDKFKGSLSSKFVDSTGTLSSADEEDMCVVGRKVEVFKARKTKADLSMGTDKVDADGLWSVPAEVTKGTYYAKVGKSEFLIREYYGVNEYAVCLADTSPDIKP